jgi:hypothetical protein
MRAERETQRGGQTNGVLDHDGSKLAMFGKCVGVIPSRRIRPVNREPG